MKFAVLLRIISGTMKLAMKTNKNVRELTRYKKLKCVMKTRDNKTGVRFLIDRGTLATDRELEDYDIAMVWKDGDTAFRVLTSGDLVGMQRAIANWDLEIQGDKSLHTWFSIFLGSSTGSVKR
jgi:hypothetical protein